MSFCRRPLEGHTRPLPNGPLKLLMARLLIAHVRDDGIKYLVRVVAERQLRHPLGCRLQCPGIPLPGRQDCLRVGGDELFQLQRAFPFKTRSVTALFPKLAPRCRASVVA